MDLQSSETLQITCEEDLVRVRQATRARAVLLGLSLVNLTKIVTAASELARNTLTFGGGGTAIVATVHNGDRPGLRLIFEDHGPGITDIELAMKDGYTGGKGLGLGLGGSKRLVNEFEISSRVGEGTRVSITRWK